MYMVSESGFEAVCTAALHTFTVTVGVFLLCVHTQEPRLHVSNLLSWTNIGQAKKQVARLPSAGENRIMSERGYFEALSFEICERRQDYREVLRACSANAEHC